MGIFRQGPYAINLGRARNLVTLRFVGSFDELAVLDYRARLRRGAGEEVPRQRREVPPGAARGRAHRPLAIPDAQSVEDLTALLTSAGER